MLAAFGVGGALGSLVVASLRLPRRYLTVMNLLWGAGCIPLVVFGFTTTSGSWWSPGFVMGAVFQAGMVIWGTLLQRRVPAGAARPGLEPGLLRLAAFMPVSMALAGRWAIGRAAPVFILAGAVPVVLAVIAIVPPDAEGRDRPPTRRPGRARGAGGRGDRGR